MMRMPGAFKRLCTGDVCCHMTSSACCYFIESPSLLASASIAGEGSRACGEGSRRSIRKYLLMVDQPWVRGVIALSGLKLSVYYLTDILWCVLSMLAKKPVEVKVGEIKSGGDSIESARLFQSSTYVDP